MEMWFPVLIALLLTYLLTIDEDDTWPFT